MGDLCDEIRELALWKMRARRAQPRSDVSLEALQVAKLVVQHQRFLSNGGKTSRQSRRNCIREARNTPPVYCHIRPPKVFDFGTRILDSGRVRHRETDLAVR